MKKLLLIFCLLTFPWILHSQDAGFFSLDSSTWRSLIPLFKQKQIVGLGEATHGTREFYSERFRISKFLIERCGYRSILIEADFGTMLPMNRFVQTGDGNPDTILKNVGAWLYYTKDMSDFIRWVREFNSARQESEQVFFLGMDMLTAPVTVDSSDQWEPLRVVNRQYSKQISKESPFYRDSCMAENVLALGRLTGTKAVVWAHNLHILRKDTISNNPQFTRPMGERLNQAIADNYFSVGFYFDSGRFMVMHREIKDGKAIHPYLRTETIKSSKKFGFARDLARSFPGGVLFCPDSATEGSKFARDFYKTQTLYNAGSMIIPGTTTHRLAPLGAFNAILFVPTSSPLVQIDDGIRETRQ